jgi:hypothetical protein
MRTPLEPPPADTSIEASLSPSLRRALDAYVALERRVQAVASGRCAPTCAACRTPCCEAVFCRESWEAPWLAAAIARPGARREVEAGRAIEGHLAADGCRLRFGRPPVCYEFACAEVLATLPTHDERYLFRVLSHVMTFAGEEALPGTHLVEAIDLRALGGARARRLARRIALAERVFEAAARLFATRGAGTREDWALVERHHPARGFRLSYGADAAREREALARARRECGARAAAPRRLPLVREVTALR